MAWIYINGKFLPEQEAALPVGDHGFLYGDGLFETIAVREGKPVFLRQHLERLEASAAYLQFHGLPGHKQWEEVVQKVQEVNAVAEGYLRLVVSRGVGPRTWEPEAYPSPSIIIFAGKGSPYSSEEYVKGWSAVISPYRQDPLSPLCRLKTLSFLPHVLARREARKRGACEALHLNLQGNIAEGTITNIFLLYRGELVTPDLESGLLPGITRAAVMALAAQEGLPVCERPVSVKEMQEAHELFLTSSLLGVMPLVKLEGQPVGRGQPGTVTTYLRQRYEEMIRRDNPVNFCLPLLGF